MLPRRLLVLIARLRRFRHAISHFLQKEKLQPPVPVQVRDRELAVLAHPHFQIVAVGDRLVQNDVDLFLRHSRLRSAQKAGGSSQSARQDLPAFHHGILPSYNYMNKIYFATQRKIPAYEFG